MENFILENLNYSPSYQNNLSNHLSMAILSLFHLGATEAQISKFNNFYITKLEKINQFDEINALKQQYLQRIDYSEKELSLIINELIPYITSAGFHAIIRSSYILSELNQQFLQSNTINQELALSFAYWRTNQFKIEYNKDKINLPTKIQQFNNLQLNDLSFPPNLIYKDLEAISQTQLFSDFSGCVDYKPTNDDLLLDFALGTYIKTRDFTAIHMVTLMHAYYIIKPYLNANNTQSIQSILWNNLLAAAIRSQRDKFDSETVTNYLDVPINVVLESTDDHLIKLYYSLTELYKLTNNQNCIIALNALMT